MGSSRKISVLSLLFLAVFLSTFAVNLHGRELKSKPKDAASHPENFFGYGGVFGVPRLGGSSSGTLPQFGFGTPFFGSVPIGAGPGGSGGFIGGVGSSKP